MEVVRSFISAYAAEFAMGAPVPPDGSHPLRWTYIHAAFRQLFDDQLQLVLKREQISHQELVEYLAELREAARRLSPDDFLPASGGLRVRGLQIFLDNLTASEDYEVFLAVMCAAAYKKDEGNPGGDSNRYLWAAGDEPSPEPSPTAAAAQVVEVEVVVPERVGEGQLVTVTYGELLYQVLVPPGCFPGTTFRVALQVPS